MPPIAIDPVEVRRARRPPCPSVSVSTKYEPPSGSTTSVTPLSCAMICCVRSASVAASAVGSASASSSELVCSELVPPSTADSACSAVRTTLLYGCCAVSDTPAVWLWKRSFHDRSFLAPKRSRIAARPDPPGGAVLGDLLEEVAVRVEEERHARHERVDVEPGVDAPLHVLDAVAQRERQLLERRRARLADVVAAHRDRVPPRHFVGAEREDVGDEPHRRARREDVLLLRDELLEDVVLNRARQRRPVGALLLGHDQVHREDHRRRRVDRHRRRDVAERDAVEQRLHVGERRDVDAALPHFAERQLVIGIAAHQRRQIERHAQAGAAGREQRLVARVGVLRRPEPGKLPHRPQLAAVAGGVNAARVGKRARLADVARGSIAATSSAV